MNEEEIHLHLPTLPLKYHYKVFIFRGEYNTKGKAWEKRWEREDGRDMGSKRE